MSVTFSPLFKNLVFSQPWHYRMHSQSFPSSWLSRFPFTLGFSIFLSFPDSPGLYFLNQKKRKNRHDWKQSLRTDKKGIEFLRKKYTTDRRRMPQGLVSKCGKVMQKNVIFYGNTQLSQFSLFLPWLSQLSQVLVFFFTFQVALFNEQCMISFIVIICCNNVKILIKLTMFPGVWGREDTMTYFCGLFAKLTGLVPEYTILVGFGTPAEVLKHSMND